MAGRAELADVPAPSPPLGLATLDPLSNGSHALAPNRRGTLASIPVRALLCLAAAAMLSSAASAQPCPALEVRNRDGNHIVPGVLGEIRYSGGQALDAYVQPGPGRRPSVVVIHGGGWSSGSRSAHIGQILEMLTRAGVHWFSVDYRLGGLPRYGDALEDLRAALAFIRCRAAELGVDATRMVLLGEDAGGHLAALLAAERPAGVVGAVSIGGFYDLTAAPGVPEDFRRTPVALAASPITRTADPMPPLLVVHGGADSDVPFAQAREYCGAVNRARGRCRLIEVPGASHRSENWWPSQWSYKQGIVAWLNDLGPVTAATGWRAGPGLEKDIVYDEPTGLKLDAFVPPGAKRGAAVIVVHGGGWEAGDKVTYVTPLFEPLARAGLRWFSIDYRLTPAFSHEEQLRDVRQAIRFVRASHERFNVDPERIFLIGESASGQMVTQVAAEDGGVAGVISFYGVYDFEAMVADASPRSLLVRLFRRNVLDDEARRVLRRHSPLHTVGKGMPPVLLVNGTADRLWEQAQAFAGRLTALGVRHDVVALEGAPHGMENWEGRPEFVGYKDRVVRWIQQIDRAGAAAAVERSLGRAD